VDVDKDLAERHAIRRQYVAQVARPA
jgi:hypothetical protein